MLLSLQCPLELGMGFVEVSVGQLISGDLSLSCPEPVHCSVLCFSAGQHADLFLHQPVWDGLAAAAQILLHGAVTTHKGRPPHTHTLPAAVIAPA